MLDWIEESFGEIVSITVAASFLTCSTVFAIREWFVWLRLRRGPPVSTSHKVLELTAVTGGTASPSLLVLLVSFVYSGLTIKTGWWLLYVWIAAGFTASILALVPLPFCRHKIRWAGLVVGVLMGELWWEMWRALQFARAYAESGGF